MVEAMAIIYIIANAHKCLINEFPHTRAGPFERILLWQRTNASTLVALNEDLQRMIEKMEARKLKCVAKKAIRNYKRPLKLLRR